MLHDVVVVGAGSAGLGIGYHLQKAGIDFVILERGEIGESWRTQRWASFALNTPNRINGLPGSPYDGDDPEGFLLRDELVEFFERHAERHELPVRTGVEVVGVTAGDEGFVVETRDGDHLRARNVVVAAGAQRVPRIPALSTRFPGSIEQLHTADYRSPDELPDGAVVVVGSGQSGCQIAEDLIAAGRTVILCTSKVARVPRRYRGRDILDWFSVTGLFHQTVDDLEDPMMQYAAQPQVSGVGPRGRTVSLQGLQRDGAVLMGRLTDVEDGVLHTDDSLGDHIEFADAFSAEIKESLDAFIEAQGLDVPPPESDPVDVTAGPEVAAAGRTSVDLAEEGVRTVVWCTGFGGDFGWLNLPVLDDRGRPIHERGVAPVPGVFFIGMPWIHSRKSGIIFGIDEDARWIADAITNRMSG